VWAAEENRLWVAEVDDTHLRARLAVACDDLGDGRRRFHVVTIVHYKRWTGPVYFRVIEPFHHLVVGAMAKAGVARAPANV
jgi:hypothetical protein